MYIAKNDDFIMMQFDNFDQKKVIINQYLLFIYWQRYLRFSIFLPSSIV